MMMAYVPAASCACCTRTYNKSSIRQLVVAVVLMMMIHLLFCFSSTTSSSCLKLEDVIEESGGFAQSKRDLASSSLFCGAVNCVKGTCTDSASIPFYQCQCEEGWKSPLGTSWIPCVLPNCSIDLGCGNSSNTPVLPAPPANGSLSACSLSVCGNGECVSSSGNSSLSYECKCNPGSTNLFNKSDGYCLEPCSLGADCSNLNISLGAPSPTPAPPSAANQNSSQGTSPLSNQTILNQGIKHTYVSNVIIVVSGVVMLLIGWCL